MNSATKQFIQQIKSKYLKNHYEEISEKVDSFLEVEKSYFQFELQLLVSQNVHKEDIFDKYDAWWESEQTTAVTSFIAKNEELLSRNKLWTEELMCERLQNQELRFSWNFYHRFARNNGTGGRTWEPLVSKRSSFQKVRILCFIQTNCKYLRKL